MTKHSRSHQRTAGLTFAAIFLTACGSTVAIDGGVLAVDNQPGAVATGTETDAANDGLAFTPAPSASPRSGSVNVGTGTTPSGTSNTGTGTSTTPSGTTAQPGTSQPGTTPGPAAGGQPAEGGQPANNGQPADDQPQPSGSNPQPAASTPPQGGTPAGGTVAPGVTDNEIVIGIAIQDDNDPGNAELLGVDISSGDVERYYEILRDDINARGGIAGRQVRYSIFRYSTAGGAQVSQLEQQACQFWANDDRAFAVSFIASPNFLGCAEDNGLVTVSNALTQSDQRAFGEFPHHVEASSMDLTRSQANLVAGLDEQGYFDAQPGQVVPPGEDAYTLGTVLWDPPAFVRAFEESFIPALQARGRTIDPDNQVQISRLQSNEDLAQVSSQIQAAVLRFRSNGVTHVTFVEDNGLLWLLFARSAENQGYRPRYGITSQSGGTTIGRTIADAGAEEQMQGAVGIGYIPAYDVLSEEKPLTDAGRTCLDLMEREGAAATQDNIQFVQLQACEFLELVRAAVDRGLPDVTPDSFIAGVEGLGTTFPAFTGLVGNAFGPSRHAGGHVYRHLVWDPACICFHYSSAPISDLG